MRRTLSTALLAIAWLMPAVIRADGLSKEMEKLFGDMTHVTQPGIVASQQRGVFTGGRFTVKSHIAQENLVSLTPPSWKAGCGGIDLFNGSFSFIKHDQIVQLLRSIAANSKGYVFQLALDNVFPDGVKWMESLQRKVQLMNQHLGNSCQLAQGVVNDLLSSADIKHKTDASLKSTVTGLSEDFFSAKQEPNGKPPMQSLKEDRPDDYKQMIGNIVWQQLKKNSAHLWFSSQDESLLEAMMSLTGTVIVGDLSKDQVNPIHLLPGNQIRLMDLIDGGSLKIYSCGKDTDQCLCPAEGKTKTLQLEGLRSKVINWLQGSGSNIGIIEKYASNQGELSEQELTFLGSLPGTFGSAIRNLSLRAAPTAHLFATESSAILALNMAYQLAETLIQETIAAQLNSNTPYKKEVTTLLERSQHTLREEYRVLTDTYGSLSTLTQKYNQLIKNVPSPEYILNCHSDQSRKVVAAEPKETGA
ncbi:MAG: conjugal transfer protein TraH (plasmid) [Candidatus Symbiodolus clandestinus]